MPKSTIPLVVRTIIGRDVPKECRRALIAKAWAANPGVKPVRVRLFVMDANGAMVCAHCGQLHRAPGVPDEKTLYRPDLARPDDLTMKGGERWQSCD